MKNTAKTGEYMTGKRYGRGRYTGSVLEIKPYLGYIDTYYFMKGTDKDGYDKNRRKGHEGCYAG